MIFVKIDTGAQFIIDTLLDNGHQAYLVGECVRDLMLDKSPDDWDIGTSALPEEIYELFDNLGISVIKTGIKHGTISVLLTEFDVKSILAGDNTLRIKQRLDDTPRIYEVTTFHKSSTMNHPEYIEFTSELETDLARQDFTINALAYNYQEGVIDYFGCCKDIHIKTIKCIKSPYKVLSENPLNILRAVRYASQLGFSIDSSILEAMDILIPQGFLYGLCPEQIQSELFKIICGKYAEEALLKYCNVIKAILPEIESTIGFDQKNKNHKYTVYEHMVKALNVLNQLGIDDTRLKVAVFLHDIGKPISARLKEDGQLNYHGHCGASAAIAERLLTRLNCTHDTIKDICDLIKYHDSRAKTKSELKRIVNKLGPVNTSRLIDLMHADILAQSNFNIDEKISTIRNMRAWLKEITEDNEQFKVQDLEINGDDLINLGYKPGIKFGLILNSLMGLVLDGKVANSHDELVDYVVSHY